MWTHGPKLLQMQVKKPTGGQKRLWGVTGGGVFVGGGGDEPQGAFSKTSSQLFKPGGKSNPKEYTLQIQQTVRGKNSCPTGQGGARKTSYVRDQEQEKEKGTTTCRCSGRVRHYLG